MIVDLFGEITMSEAFSQKTQKD